MQIPHPYKNNNSYIHMLTHKNIHHIVKAMLNPGAYNGNNRILQNFQGKENSKMSLF